MAKGSCYCGTVRYEVQGPFRAMVNCHCSMCRKHHGSPFATYVSVSIDSFRWVSGGDALIRYASSTGCTRDSCEVCGSPVPLVMVRDDVVLLPAGPLEGDLGLTPQAHMFVGSKAPWYAITDRLPQHEEYPPQAVMPALQHSGVEARPAGTEGSCLCGDMAYEIEGEPIRMQSCHCQRCRRSKGAAHATNIFYKASQFRWTRGEALLAEYKLPEARFSTSAFCRQCGAVMPRVSRERDMAVIAAGSLDTDAPLRSQRHIFTSYKASWFEITDTAPQFPEGPPSP